MHYRYLPEGMSRRHFLSHLAGASAMAWPAMSFAQTLRKNSANLKKRNKAAIKILEDSLKQGKKDIVIFYGAAHMPDMSKRLIDLGFKPVATEWRQAWDLTIRADQPSAVEEMLMQLIRGLDEEQM